MRGGSIALMIAALAPAQALAEEIPDAAAMRALEAAVPPQPWYPEGYYDLRIAAEAQVAEYPRPQAALLAAPSGGSTLYFDLIACGTERVAADAADPAALRYGDVALETARLRSEFARLDYPADVYAEPLLAYEKASLERADGASGPDSPLAALAAAAEAKRARIAPALAPVIARGLCEMVRIERQARERESAYEMMGAAPRRPTVMVGTEPAGGEILLVNAFAFKVCTRKTPDPWDRFACKWNEIQAGAGQPLSGRYVYQVKWPDGTVRKGTREIAP
ncbi:MAG TPA: hypothetical protein PKD48_12795, partial [Sphingopyxis sp.]|nr:hypothetical protein [Sphingopyxis sp.]